MDASSTFAGLLQSFLSLQERGDHKIGVFTALLIHQRAANQVDSRIPQPISRECHKSAA